MNDTPASNWLSLLSLSPVSLNAYPMVELGYAEGGDEARHLLRRVAVSASRH
jgi:hypothetical protein